MIKEISLSTSRRNELIDVTKEIKEIIKQSKIKQGICVVYCLHTTAGITINESADPDVQRDILVNLSKLIPKDGDYQHSEGNSDAHIKSSLIGASEILIIKDNSLILGTWQNIYFAEFDGPRQRKVIVKIIN
ncbi:secondary thiamine-phosphate synthase enzyme YjbQ [Candidatus Woesearchaeota archaeon]|nr:secondary thiamine-phosphate synthase enzyme YjbQ [Candidatus Woesearchaeota archaeon]